MDNFVHEARGAYRRRKRTLIACSRCKLHKHKCSGSRPCCTSCQKAGSACQYRDPRMKPVKFVMQNPLLPDNLPSKPTLKRVPTPRHSVEDICALVGRQKAPASRAIRVPFFRWFGPTGIAPGYKKMLFDVSQLPLPTSEPSSNDNPYDNAVALVRPQVTMSVAWFEEDGITPVSAILYPLLDTFFHYYGCHFPFYSRESFITSVRNKQISALVLNSVCGLAARFSSLSAFQHYPPYQRGEVFAEKAKVLLVPLLNLPSYDVVAAILIIVWLELAGNRDVGVWMYMGMACRMAMDLGMHKAAISGPEKLTPQEYWIVSRVWYSVYHLDHIISFATGRPLSIERRYIDVPPPFIDGDVDYPSPFPGMVTVMQSLGLLHDELNGVTNQASILEPTTTRRLVAYSDNLVQYYVNLPVTLSFNINNFQIYVTKGEGGTFLMLHLWFNAIMIGLHHPGLRYGQQVDAKDVFLTPESQAIALSSARTISSILSLAEVVSLDSILSSPFIDQAVEVAGLAFIAELASTQDTLKRITNRSNYDVCLRTLQTLIFHFKGVGWVTTTMQQKERGMRETDPAEGSVDPQSLIELQDTKMMRKLLEKAEQALSDNQIGKAQKSIGVGFSGVTSGAGQGSIMFLHPTSPAHHNPHTSSISNPSELLASDYMAEANFISQAALIEGEAWDSWLDVNFWADLDIPLDAGFGQ